MLIDDDVDALRTLTPNKNPYTTLQQHGIIVNQLKAYISYALQFLCFDGHLSGNIKK